MAVSRTSSAARPRGAPMKSRVRSNPSESMKVTTPVTGVGSLGDGIHHGRIEKPCRTPCSVSVALEIDVLAGDRLYLSAAVGKAGAPKRERLAADENDLGVPGQRHELAENPLNFLWS